MTRLTAFATFLGLADLAEADFALLFTLFA